MLVEIGDKIVSTQIFERKFVCDLNACKGACCVEGDSGAPLLKNEAQELEKFYPIIKKYLSSNGKKAIKKQGFSIIDADNDIDNNNTFTTYLFLILK